MAKGDHLVVQFGPYTHHGIDMGDGRVIHFGRGLHNKVNAQVEIVDTCDFAGERSMHVRNQTAAFDSDEIIRRATSRLGQSNYDLFENNCEHFVNWCRTGVADSSQINLVDSVCRRGQAAAAKIALPKLAGRFVFREATTRAFGRFSMPAGLPAALAADAVQLSAEVVAIRSGKDRDRSRQIGRKSGALASSGIGFMLGGPAGAAIGLGSWLFGEACSR